MDANRTTSQLRADLAYALNEDYNNTFFAVVAKYANDNSINIPLVSMFWTQAHHFANWTHKDLMAVLEKAPAPDSY